MTPPASAGERRRFIAGNARLAAPPLTPEIRLWLAAEATALWEASETFLEKTGLPPPFWAFAWAGGQALARYVLDHPDTVAGLRVLDFGAGGGLVAVAALLSGARTALAADTDPFAAVAAEMNAEANGRAMVTWTGDATALDPSAFDVILAADVCYERGPAAAALAWLHGAADAGATVLLGDPGRAYFAAEGLDMCAAYDVPTPTDLERTEVTPAHVWRFAANV